MAPHHGNLGNTSGARHTEVGHGALLPLRTFQDAARVTSATVPQRWTCSRCGVHSCEPSCFANPPSNGRRARDVRCIACHVDSRGKGIGRLPLITLVPLAMAFVVAETWSGFLALLLLSALALVVLVPLSIVLHELAHALVATLVGLEVGGFVLGTGPVIWAGELRGVPAEVRTFPGGGFTSLGCNGTSWPRLRFWLATAAGPAADVALTILAVAFWVPFSNAVSAPVAALCVAITATSVAINLFPFLHRQFGDLAATDGLILLLLPTISRDSLLAGWRISAPLFRARLSLARGAFATAHAASMEGLARAPGHAQLQLYLSASLIYQNGAQAALDVLRRILGEIGSVEPIWRAVAQSDASVALMLCKRGTVEEAAAMKEADELSRLAFEAFPCLLSQRFARAVVLTWTGRAPEALQLLARRPYRGAARSLCGERLVATALALRSLGNHEDAARALAAARDFWPPSAGLYESLAAGQQ